MSDGRVEFDIVGNDKGINQTIKQVTTNIQQESKKWDQSADQATKSMEDAFSGMLKKVAGYFSAAKISQTLLSWGKAAIDAASDLREVQNVVDTVFGDGAAKIEAWSKKAITQFGLTETQAKKFTSTLGAMMKTSGLAGDEIVSMSTDLAGLAADMASFYNMDFETAFEKIRSGISGETMPLKQLGINMSVANLEAFALAQGLEKTFSQMSQGEQTMLRYQYLMSVTSDAQGDFAKTSSGYANSVRLIESNIESLKTTLGTPFLSAVEKATGFVNKLITTLLPEEKEETVLDRIRDIDINKEAKLREISEIAEVARALADDMEKISGNEDVDKVVRKLANSANVLKADSKTNWEGVLQSLTSINGLENMFGDNSTAVQNISDLALALSGNSPTMTQADAWDKLLGAMTNNKDVIASMTGKTAEGAEEWLKGLAEAAGKIEPGDVAAWQQLMNILLGGVDTNSEEGKQFIDSLVENFLAMGAGSEEAVSALTALGFTTDEISEKQATWLAYCKELVATIPGLSSIIDTNTGEIKGGLPALEDYVDEWERLSKYQAEIAAINEQKSILEELYDTNALKGKSVAAKSKIEALLEFRGYGSKELGYVGDIAEQVAFRARHGEALALKDLLWEYENYQHNTSIGNYAPSTLIQSLTEDERTALEDYLNALYAYEQAVTVLPIIEQKIQDEMDKTAEEYGVTKDEIESLTGAAESAETQITLLQQAMSGDEAATKKIETAYKNAGSALQAVADYYKQVRDATEQTVNSTLKGFDNITTAYDELNQKSRELATEETQVLNSYSDVFDNLGSDSDALKDMEKNWDKLTDREKEAHEALVKVRNAQNEVNESMNQYEPEGMKANLQSQIRFMDEYLKNLAQLKEWGVSEEMISQLSDGSKESAAYLQGLVAGGKEEAGKVGDLYDKVAEKKKTFSETLTDSKLEADETFRGLVDTAIQAISDLDLQDEAQKSLKDTVQGIADGIGEGLPGVTTAIDAIISQLDRLNSYGISFSLGTIFYPHSHIPMSENDVIYEGPGSFATGLDYVPRDNFPAFLHEGEGILTKEENKVWQGYKNGQTGVDYDALGGVMRDNVKAGGNVYLDGRTVGQVISDIQGRSYRNLQRSGWQG